MVNDRGTKKWTSLMLPEHIKMLEGIWKEDEKKLKPMMDEQLQIEFGSLLQLALKDDLTVEVTYYADFNFHTAKGKLTMIDALNRRLQFPDMEINMDAITEVTIL